MVDTHSRHTNDNNDSKMGSQACDSKQTTKGDRAHGSNTNRRREVHACIASEKASAVEMVHNAREANIHAHKRTCGGGGCEENSTSHTRDARASI